MDWLASDLPIVTHSNGAILVMTMDLKSSSSAMADMDLDGRLLWDLESKVYLEPLKVFFSSSPPCSFGTLPNMQVVNDSFS